MPPFATKKARERKLHVKGVLILGILYIQDKRPNGGGSTASINTQRLADICDSKSTNVLNLLFFYKKKS